MPELKRKREFASLRERIESREAVAAGYNDKLAELGHPQVGIAAEIAAADAERNAALTPPPAEAE